MWTVPGGKLETKDYISLPKDTKEYWYNVLEQVLKREVKEEVGIKIKNKDETDDFKWVTLSEAKAYDLIDGIYDELVMAEAHLKGTKTEWRHT